MWNSPLAAGHCAQQADLRTAAGLAHDGDVRRVAAEVRDIGLYPFQSRHDVQHPGVARVAVLFTAGAGQVGKTQRSEAMIYRAEHNVAVAGDILPVVAVLFDAVTLRETPAVEPYQYRTAFAVGKARASRC